MILSALLLRLEEKGVISEQERKEIADLYKLHSVLEGKLKNYFSPEEVQYLNKVSSLLSEGSIEKLEENEPPKTLKKLYDTLMSTIPLVKKVIKR